MGGREASRMSQAQLHHLISTDLSVVDAADPNIFFGLRKRIQKTDRRPGPTTYFPQNELFGRTPPKALHRYISAPIYSYYFKTSVPVIERAYIKKANLEPGPGRFDPPSAIGPTHPPRQEYWPDVFIMEELARIKKFRGLPHRKYNLQNYVEDANLRNIKGHGFTRLFKSPPSDKWVYHRNATDKEFITALEEGYQGKINNPRRQVLSFRSEPIKYKEKPMELNIGKKIKRRKAYENNKVAFFSGCARWPDEVFTKRIEVQKRQDEGIPKNPAYKDIKSKFKIIPKKYKPRVQKIVKYYKFGKEPPTKRIFDGRTIGKHETAELTTYFKEIDVNEYLKNDAANKKKPHFVETPRMASVRFSQAVI